MMNLWQTSTNMHRNINCPAKVSVMKKIFLLGDSIRAGYDKYIKRSLVNVAEVYYPEENCRFTTYLMRALNGYRKKLGITELDLIHWNVGLWDNLVMQDGKNLVSIDTYGENIDRLCNIFKTVFPGAKMIFATSTPVQEELYGDFKRYNRDIEAYNEVAVKIVKSYGGEINDLYKLLEGAPSSYHSDATHYYTREATELITNQVLNSIENTLGIKGQRLDFDALFEEEKNIVGI